MSKERGNMPFEFYSQSLYATHTQIWKPLTKLLEQMERLLKQVRWPGDVC